MIIRHQGVSIASGKNVTRYAVHMDGKSYIFFDSGCRIQVYEVLGNKGKKLLHGMANMLVKVDID